jgi:hypothetical protein
MTNQQDEKIELTPAQQNPYLARPEDFEVVSPDAIANRTQPFHGQRGDSDREEAKLLAIRKAQNKGVELPTATDDAGEPHIGKRQ